LIAIAAESRYNYTSSEETMLIRFTHSTNSIGKHHDV
jgi:hypothetical protein